MMRSPIRTDRLNSNRPLVNHKIHIQNRSLNLLVQGAFVIIVLSLLPACLPIANEQNYKVPSLLSEPQLNHFEEAQDLYAWVLPASNLEGCLFVKYESDPTPICYSARNFKKGEHIGLGIELPKNKEKLTHLSHNLLATDFRITPIVMTFPSSKKYQLRQSFLACLLIGGMALGLILYNSLIMIQGQHWWKLTSSALGLGLLIHILYSYQLLPFPHSKLDSFFSYLNITLIIPLIALTSSLLPRPIETIYKAFLVLAVLTLIGLAITFTNAIYVGLLYVAIALVSMAHSVYTNNKLSKLAWLFISLAIITKPLSGMHQALPYLYMVSDVFIIIGILFLALTQINMTDGFYNQEKLQKDQFKKQASLISVVSHELRNSAQIISSLVERCGDKTFTTETKQLTQLLENVLDTIYFQNENITSKRNRIDLNTLSGWKALEDLGNITRKWDNDFTPSFFVYERIFNRWLFVLAQRIDKHSNIEVRIKKFSIDLKIKNKFGNFWNESEDKNLLFQLDSSLSKKLRINTSSTKKHSEYQIPITGLRWNISTRIESLGKLRILIVEDEEITQNMIKTWLIEKGHDVIQCRDGSLALKIIEDEKPDLILLDNQLPNKTGIEILDRLNKLKERRTKIILTSADFNETPSESIKILQKPIDKRSLINCIQLIMNEEIKEKSYRSPMEDLSRIQKDTILEKLIPTMESDFELVVKQIKGKQLKEAAETLHRLEGRLSMIGLINFKQELKELENRVLSQHTSISNLKYHNESILEGVNSTMNAIIVACNKILEDNNQ